MFPLEFFLMQDMFPQRLWFLGVSKQVIVVSGSWILRGLNVYSHLLGCNNKRRCGRCTTLVTRKLLRFLRIDQEWSPFVFVKRASEGAAIWAGSKMECVELCNFYFCCAFNEKISIFFHDILKRKNGTWFTVATRPRGVLLQKLGKGVRPASQNPYPIRSPVMGSW